jgi:hypothetical protein
VTPLTVKVDGGVTVPAEVVPVFLTVIVTVIGSPTLTELGEAEIDEPENDEAATVVTLRESVPVV